MKWSVIYQDGRTRSFDLRPRTEGNPTAPLWIILAVLAGVVFSLGYYLQ